MENPALDYIERMASNPTRFMRQTELWVVDTPLSPQEDRIAIRTFDESGLCRPYLMDAAFVSKFVLTKNPEGKKAMFIVSTDLISPLHLATMLDKIDFDKVKFDRLGYIKGEFAAPATRKYGTLITGSSKDPDIVVIPCDKLVDPDGRMILLNNNEGNQPDWVHSWNICYTSEGVNLVARTAAGRLLQQITCGHDRRYRNITPAGVDVVNDVVSIPRNGKEPELMIATTNGLIFRDDIVAETAALNIDNLCYDLDSQVLWMRTRDGRVFRSWYEGGKLLPPEEWSKGNVIFSEAVSHKLLCGASTRNPILTAWGQPTEITKDNRGTGRFTVKYHRMEVLQYAKASEQVVSC